MNSCRVIVKLFLCNYQVIVKLLSCNCQVIVKLLSGPCQVIVKLLPGYCQVIFRLLSDYCHVIVRVLSDPYTLLFLKNNLDIYRIFKATITLGGVGGPDTNDDIDDALRGWGGNHQNDDVIYEWVLSELP